jgi:hypothetical protein
MRLELGQLKINPYGEHYFEEINGLSFAKQSSGMVFDKQYDSVFDKVEMLNIIIGTDSGLLYDYIASKDLPESASFVFFEFPEVIQALDLKDIEDKSIMVVDIGFDINQLAVSHMSYLIQQRLRLHRSISIVDAAANSVMHELWLVMEANYQKFLSQELIALNSKPFIEAQLDNLADNLLPLSQYKNYLSGSSALILGGGPTLDESIDWIKDNREGVVIFSAARIARRLAKEGITPDFFVSVDPHDVSFDNSKGIFQFEDQSVLLSGHHMSPLILSQWTGLKSYIGDKFPWKDKNENKNIDSPGPNVINTAVYLAFELGCENFIFSGVDLCFPGGQAYESSSDEAQIGGTFMFNQIQRVKNNAGEWVTTQPRYALSRDSMETQVAFYKRKKPELNFIHLSLEAAYIEGVEHIPQEMISFTQADQVQAQMDKFKADLTLSAKETLKKIQETRKTFQKQKKRFLDIVNESKLALKLIPSLYNAGQEDNKVVKKVLKAKNNINKWIGDDGDMLFHYDFSSFKGSFKYVADEQKMSQDEVSQQLEAFFSGINQASDGFLKQMKASERFLKLREKELLHQGSLSSLFEEWQEVDQPGRVGLWKKWHSESLSEQDQMIIEQAEGLFRDKLALTETKQVQALKKRSTNLKSLFQRLSKAFKNHDVKDLRDTLDYLHKQKSPEKEAEYQRDLLLIGQGMLLQVEKNNQEALVHYLAVSGASLRHDALKYALGVTNKQGNHELTLQILEQLCQFSFEYMLPYADLLAMLGNNQGSVGILKLYIEKHPEDVSSKLKLIQKLIETDNKEEAKYWLSSISEQDNSHKKIILHLLEQLN